MKENAKWFILGAIVTLVLTNIITAFSNSFEKTILAVYDGIKIVVDGALITPKDADGNEVEPFTYNDTTYLPVRAVSEALGKEVSWDEDTKTVYIGENIPVEEVTVSNAEELIKAIGSNKKIMLESGEYDLTNLSKESASENYYWENVYDGYQLVITKVNNLTIEGPDDGVAEIKTTARYAEIISFRDANNIAVRNIKAGHAPKPYECDAGVLEFTNCKNTTLDNDYLYGCGSVGVSANQCEALSIYNSVITDCSLRGIDIYKSCDVTVAGTKFTENRAYSNVFYIVSSRNVVFEECVIDGNKNLEWGLLESSASSVTFDKCDFNNNSYRDNYNSDVYMFSTNGGNTTVRNCVIQNNKFTAITSNNSTAFENCITDNNSFPAL